ncbi:MAG: GGDEF domain-containing protein [Edaphobacter sp.]|uniref:GGDEF domain-containing protein n=1 Tax=Edaphobacter sp. TaxID=1934404 RepID=UPI002393792E|nr:GGDEF domain-containing protein [Edaphobacter sp.]MDE1174988.1 GGDEF domain-containing protein [Edaphobacter sp.]
MNYAFLPDLSALAILIAILLLMRRKHPQEHTDLWLIGLLITLVESMAHIFYAPDGLPATVLHVVVVDCYLLAGLVFCWDSREHPIPAMTRMLYLVINGLPLLAINTTYGLHIFRPAPYYPWIAVGVLTAIGSSIILHRPRFSTVVHLAGWIAIGILVDHGKYRDAVYWSLSGVYAIAGIKFQKRLPTQSTGRLAIMTGFFIWSICFFVHPFIVTFRAYADIASHVWNMQKSLISIGMILVMLEQQLSCNRWLALHDELTGLPNRRAFEDQLSIALDRCRRSETTLALFMLDLDGFKQINDNFGHQAGDQMLRHVATSLRENLRGFDAMARLGGDEFTLVTCNPEATQSIEQISDRICSIIERPLLYDNQTLRVSASIGIAIFPDDAADSTRLLRIADLRMYSLKQKRTPLRHIRLDSVPSLTASGRFRSHMAGGH